MKNFIVQFFASLLAVIIGISIIASLPRFVGKEHIDYEVTNADKT